jgi:hypothetical protein
MCRPGSKLLGFFSLLVLLSVSGAVAQPPNLVYQSRGKYREGIRTTLSTGPTLDLIAALVDYQDMQLLSALPQVFGARFYLPDGRPASLVIREIKPRYFYWLGDLSAPTWQTGKANDFVWPTDKVVRFLNWDHSGPLRLTDLGAIVRIGNQTPSGLEVVAPVALYQMRAPDMVDGYRFVFLPNQQMRLQFQIFRAEDSNALETQPAVRILANAPHAVTWKAGRLSAGWYRLVGSGYAVSDNARVNAEVRFYHSSRLGK